MKKWIKDNWKFITLTLIGFAIWGIILGMILFLVILVGSAIGELVTTPATIYEIRYPNHIIYTDNYTTANGFVTVSDYYKSDLFPPWHDHVQKPIILQQGNIKIIER